MHITTDVNTRPSVDMRHANEQQTVVLLLCSHTDLFVALHCAILKLCCCEHNHCGLVLSSSPTADPYMTCFFLSCLILEKFNHCWETYKED